MATFDYDSLNLARNPFGEVPFGELSELAVVNIESVLEHLREPRSAVEFVGSPGRGKTTCLAAVAEGAESANWIEISKDGTPAEPRCEGWPVVDEIDFMAPDDRRKLFERVERLAAASHNSVADELADAGLAVRSVDVEVSREKLRAIVTRRIEWVRDGSGDVPTVPEPVLDALWNRYGSDLRAIQDCLYETFQVIGEARALTVEDLDDVLYEPSSSTERATVPKLE